MLIALTGRKFSGKDYLAHYLIAQHGFVRVSFSDQLKLLADKIYPWSAPNLEVKPEDKEKVIPHPYNVNGYTYRELWVSLDKLREVDPQVFIHGVRHAVHELTSEGKDVVITDIRKQLEFDMCEELEFNTIKIKNVVDPSSCPTEDIIDEFDVDLTFEHDKTGRTKFKCFLTDTIGLEFLDIDYEK